MFGEISVKWRVFSCFCYRSCLDLFLLTCKNKNLIFHPEVKGQCYKCPPVFDGLIDIQHVPGSSPFYQCSNKWEKVQTNEGMGAQRTLLESSMGREAFCACHGNSHLWKTKQFQIRKQRIAQSCLPNRLSNGKSREYNRSVNNSGSSSLHSHISAWSLQDSRLVFNWIWIELTTRCLFFMTRLHWAPGAVPACIDISLRTGVRIFSGLYYSYLKSFTLGKSNRIAKVFIPLQLFYNLSATVFNIIYWERPTETSA